MQEKSSLYFGPGGQTPIGNLWLAVSELGLVAIDCGPTQAEFEAFLIKRFKHPVQYAPARAGEVSRIYLDAGKHAEAQADLNQVLHYRSNSAEALPRIRKVTDSQFG